jgi:hypothetical protein
MWIRWIRIRIRIRIRNTLVEIFFHIPRVSLYIRNRRARKYNGQLNVTGYYGDLALKRCLVVGETELAAEIVIVNVLFSKV